MNKSKRYKLIIVLLLMADVLFAQKVLKTDVLVVGGGTSGTAAGIQSARAGARTIIAESTTWLGGMITAAGVSAFDGNHNMPSGIFGEFREKLYKVYGGPAQVFTGWVSNTMFEPHTGDSILKSMVANTNNLSVLYRHKFIKALQKGNKIIGAQFHDEATGKTVLVYAKQTIDATELGDVMASAHIPFDIGMEASAVTGEDAGVPESNDIIQDITYVAIVKDYGRGTDRTIKKPAGYDPMEFDGCCNEYCSKPEKLRSNVSAKKMLDYGKLPHGKYMLNWPANGNDIYLNLVSLTPAQRTVALNKAKAKTLRFLYFLQSQFGFKNLGLADDEFSTTDQLPLIAYYREGRRVKGVTRFKVQHIARPFEQAEPLYRTGIAVGDYPIDHHHDENPAAPQHINLYPVPSFNVPLGSLIPFQRDGIIIAEKGISVSNIVNGTTRLQPCVMLIGQAAGMLAALAVLQNSEPRQVSVRSVQENLLKSGAYIMPYYDVKPSDVHFTDIQKIGATGILKGKGEPYQWANRTWFYPDSLVNTSTLIKDIAPFGKLQYYTSQYLSIAEAIRIVQQLGAAYSITNEFDFVHYDKLVPQIRVSWGKWRLNDFGEDRKITRAELCVLLEKTIDPFKLKQVNHSGNFKP